MIFRKLEELKPHPQNDYYFDDTEEAAFKLLKDDIESYGKIRNPILISTNNIIISGHQRYRAYQELGKEQIQCMELDKRLTDEDLEYILIMENLTARNSSKSSNKLKLGRCINKICEYCNLSNGNNQYTGKRVGNNFLPKEIKSFKSKQEIADAFELTTRTLNDYQSLARNGIEELETIVENGKINDTSAIKISRLPKEKQEEVVEEISSMNKATVKDVADIINSINNKTTKMGVEEVTTPKTQYDPNSVTFEDLESYNRHGNGDKSTIEALKELKIKVPSQVKVFGYDNSLLSEIATTPIATVEQPIELMSEKAAEMLEKLMDGERPEESHIVVPVKLVKRKTGK